MIITFIGNWWLIKCDQSNLISLSLYNLPEDAEGEFQVAHEKPVAGRIVSKKHLGEFLVDSLTQDEHIHKRIGMGTVAPPQQPPQQ